MRAGYSCHLFDIVRQDVGQIAWIFSSNLEKQITVCICLMDLCIESIFESFLATSFSLPCVVLRSTKATTNCPSMRGSTDTVNLRKTPNLQSLHILFLVVPSVIPSSPAISTKDIELFAESQQAVCQLRQAESSAYLHILTRHL